MSTFLVILAVVAVYLVSLRVFPWWTCRSCEGSEVRKGPGRAHQRCLRCRGNGRYPRAGVRVLMPGTARKMRDGEKGRFY